jgi:hypothetical protein
VPGIGIGAGLGDLPPVVLPDERQRRGGLAEPGIGVDGDGTFGLVAVLQVGVDDVPEVLRGGPSSGAS